MITKLSYYAVTIFFVLFCSALATITGLKHKRKNNALNFFYLYPLASFIQTTLAYTLIYLLIDPLTFDTVNNSVENTFLLTEFLVINDFYRKVLKSHKLKQLLKATAFLFVAILLIYWNNHFLTFPIHFFVIQACFILIPTFAYFYELFKRPVSTNLLTDFSIWISSGIIFYFSCTLPTFLLMGFIYANSGGVSETNVYSINHICYGVLFLFTTKAYLCPQKICSIKT